MEEGEGFLQLVRPQEAQEMQLGDRTDWLIGRQTKDLYVQGHYELGGQASTLMCTHWENQESNNELLTQLRC